MSKHKSGDSRNSYIEHVPLKTFCPECHRAVKYVVPGGNITYFVHDIDDACVIDNDPFSGSGKGMKHG